MPDTQTVTQNTAPWAPLQPYLQNGFSRAENLYQAGGPSYYPNSTVAPFGADTNAALDMFRGTAQAGSPVTGAANSHISNTLNGDYLNSNPYLDATFDRAASGVSRHFQEAVTPSIAAQFGMSGRSGSPAMANNFDSAYDQLGRSLEGLGSNIYGNNYQQERGRQMQAAGLAPQTAELNYFDANQLLNVGNLVDNKAQQNVTDQFNRYMFNEEKPYDNLGRYFGNLGGSYGSSSTATQPVYNNNLAQGVGLGLTGLGLLNDVGGLSGLGGLLGL